MKPTINSTESGQLSIANHSISYDFFINAEGKVISREKSLTEKSDLHTISLTEANYCYDPSINEMIIGCTPEDKLMLSNEATDFFEEKRCKIKLLPLNEAVIYWNRYEGRAIGLFHISSK